MPATLARLRTHPHERFEGDEHLIDLVAAAQWLRREPHHAVAGHRQIALIRSGRLTQVLYVFERGGHLKDHQSDGVMTVQVLKGWLRVITSGGEQELQPGRLLVVTPGAHLAVQAQVPAEMLLTVCHEAHGGGGA
jgi:quercetin dioxygenase-like cupin family protein